MIVQLVVFIFLGILLIGSIVLIVKGFPKAKTECEHDYTEHLTLSGYGYTEYEVWFCKRCPKIFGKQTKKF